MQQKQKQKDIVYNIMENCGESFRVIIKHNGKKKDVYVYKGLDKVKEPDFINPIYVFKNVKKIFAGGNLVCPSTIWPGSFRNEFVGNSVLINTKKKEYVCITENMYKFTALSKITNFYSPVHNSNVTDPFAFDKQGNYYNLHRWKVLVDTKAINPLYKNLIFCYYRKKGRPLWREVTYYEYKYGEYEGLPNLKTNWPKNLKEGDITLEYCSGKDKKKCIEAQDNGVYEDFIEIEKEVLCERWI